MEIPRIYRVPVEGGAAQPLFEAKGVSNLDCTGKAANLCVYSSDSDDGRELVFTAFDPIAGKAKELVRVQVTPGEGYGWMLSRNGAEVAFVKGSGSPLQVQLVSLHRGTTRTIEVRGNFLGTTSIGWTLDSKSVFLGTEGTNSATLLRVDLNGNVQPLWKLPHRGVTYASPSPDGHYLAMGSSVSSSNVWLIDEF